MVKKEIKFQPFSFAKDYYPPVSIEKTYKKDENGILTDDVQLSSVEERPAKSFWWLYAIILFLIGVGAIVYHYYYEAV